jgi:hypothetical protein
MARSRERTNRAFRSLGLASFAVSGVSVVAALWSEVSPFVVGALSSIEGTTVLAAAVGAGAFLTLSPTARSFIKSSVFAAAPAVPRLPPTPSSSYEIIRDFDEVYLKVLGTRIGPYTGPTAEEHARMDGDLLTRITDADVDEAFLHLDSTKKLLAAAPTPR